MPLILLFLICVYGYGADLFVSDDLPTIKALHRMKSIGLALQTFQWEAEQVPFESDQKFFALLSIKEFLNMCDKKDIFQIHNPNELMECASSVRSMLVSICRKELNDCPQPCNVVKKKCCPLNMLTFFLAFSALCAEHAFSKNYERYRTQYIQKYKKEITAVGSFDRKYVYLYHKLLESFKFFFEGDERASSAYRSWQRIMKSVSYARRGKAMEKVI